MKLSDIKSQDGKEGLMIEKKLIKQYPLRSLQQEFQINNYVNNIIEKQSQRQVAVEVDSHEMIKTLLVTRFVNKDGDISLDKIADAIITHKEELFKIIYVKD